MRIHALPHCLCFCVLLLGVTTAEGAPPSDAALRAAATYAYAHVRGQSGNWPRPEDKPLPAVVFISVGRHREVAKVTVGRADTLGQAVERALTACGADPAAEVVRLDIVTQQTDPAPWHGGLPGWQAGEGVALLFGEGGQERVWLLPDELIARDLVDYDTDQLRLGRLDAYLRGKRAKVYQSYEAPAAFVRFRTHGVAVTAEGVFPPAKAPEHAMLRARLAGRYLASVVQEDGEFVYEYDADRDRPESGYNMLRHAGSSFAMAQLLRADPNSAAIRPALDRAVAYMKSEMAQSEDGTQAVLLDKGNVKLGGNGLALLALSEYSVASGTTHHLELARKLARWIAANQETSGRFKVHKMHWETKTVSDFRSGYYPGEAAFGLVRLYELTKEEKWLDVAYLAARYTGRRLLKDGRIVPGEHDHWLLYALDHIHRHRPDEEFLESAREIVKAIQRTQHSVQDDNINPSWFGGWYQPPRYTPASTRCEGLGAAYRMFQRAKDAKSATMARETLNAGIAFLNRGQIGPDRALFFPDPERVLGGVSGGITNMDIRVDYPQHALSAWLAHSRITAE